MERRSTSAQFTHFRGDVTAQVESSHGVRLSGGTTGGIVEAVGDDTNISLRLRAQGAGSILIGAASQPVTFTSTGITYSSGTVMQVGSTAPFAGFIRNVAFNSSTPALSTDITAMAESTITITGANSSHVVVVNPTNLSTDITFSHAWVGSTANEVHLMFRKTPTTLAVAASTFSANLAVIRF